VIGKEKSIDNHQSPIINPKDATDKSESSFSREGVLDTYSSGNFVFLSSTFPGRDLFLSRSVLIFFSPETIISELHKNGGTSLMECLFEWGTSLFGEHC
jgi:hypothetical protein